MSVRHWAGLASAVILASCQPLPHPFAGDKPSAALVAVPDSVFIGVGEFAGEPHATAAKLPAAVAHELLAHNIPASDAATSKGSYQLDGHIVERPDRPGQSVVTVFWRLRDPRGNVVSERSDQLAAPTRGWDAGDDGSVGKLAASGAKGIAALLADDTPKEAPAGGRIRVAVRKIAGAPGDGDTSLASSLNAVLKHQDIELVDPANGRPDVAVDGEVKVDPARDGQQHVKIVWHVAHPAGGEIGQVAQENEVPRGRLDGPWGDIAYSVAMAAEGGIMQLVGRAAPPHARPALPPVDATAAAAASAAGPSAMGAAPFAKPPPVAGNVDSPEVNLPPVDVKPAPEAMPRPLPAPDVPVILPYRGVPIPH